MNILDDLKLRGMVNNITNVDKLKEFFKYNNGLYIGFDPSFKSLHLGNYVLIRVLEKFKKEGYKTYALIGGATGMIGDPSGKNSERKLLDSETLKENVLAVSQQIKALTNSQIINNCENYKDMNIINFLRDIGKYFNVNYLLEKDVIKSRLESGISYTELTYSLLQAYDFYLLYKNKKVVLQIGGSDQWGNITAGIEFIRKRIGDNNLAIGLTINLLTKSDGTKFGKSESGAIYLDKNLTSPYEMYQFLLNQSDQDVEKLLNFLSSYTINEIKEIIQQHKTKLSLRYAQKELANNVVKDIHGIEELKKCQLISNAVFNNKLETLKPEYLEIALKTLKAFEIKTSSINILDLLVNAKICSSKSNARQLINSKGISINGKLIDSITTNINKKDAIKKQFSYIKKGKRDYFLVSWK